MLLDLATTKSEQAYVRIKGHKSACKHLKLTVRCVTCTHTHVHILSRLPSNQIKSVALTSQSCRPLLHRLRCFFIIYLAVLLFSQRITNATNQTSPCFLLMLHLPTFVVVAGKMSTKNEMSSFVFRSHTAHENSCYKFK